MKHYSLALWGIRLRIDPDYPIVTRFFPVYIVDTVLEYRSYALVLIWAVFLGWVCRPDRTLLWVSFWILLGCWFVQSCRRAVYYSSAFKFWERAWTESPDKPRVLTRFAENVMMELEREMKAGKTWDECKPLIDLGLRLVDDVTKIQAAIENSKKVPVNPRLNG